MTRYVRIRRVVAALAGVLVTGAATATPAAAAAGAGDTAIRTGTAFGAGEPVSIPGVEVLTARPAPMRLTTEAAQALEQAKAAVAKNSTVLAPPYVDRTTGEVVFPSVDGRGAAAARAAAAELGTAVRFRHARASRSVAQLETIKNEVLALPEDILPGSDGAYAAYVDAEQNRVMVEAGAVGEGMLAALRARYGNGSVAVLYVKGTSGGMPAARNSDVSPFKGGANITMSTGGGCTSGFAWLGATGQHWMITAGHCVATASESAPGSVTVSTPVARIGSIQANSENWGPSGTTLFAGQPAVFRGDIARITVSGGARVEGRIFVGPAGASLSTMAVSGLNSPNRVGNQFCSSGAISGNQCGWVVDFVDGAWQYGMNGPVARNVSGATKMGRCIIGGDSGAPVYATTSSVTALAAGIISGAGGYGGPDAFASPGEVPCRAVFTDTQDVVAAFGGGPARLFG